MSELDVLIAALPDRDRLFVVERLERIDEEMRELAAELVERAGRAGVLDLSDDEGTA